jgi:hypothetical protein
VFSLEGFFRTMYQPSGATAKSLVDSSSEQRINRLLDASKYTGWSVLARLVL